MSLTPKQQFLEDYDNEHATTMRVLRAYPPDKAELRPSERSLEDVFLQLTGEESNP